MRRLLRPPTTVPENFTASTKMGKRTPRNKPETTTSSKQDAIDTALDVSELILTTLTTAAQLAPVPYLQEAAGLALGIFNTIRGAKDNKDSFNRLASDACELVYTVLCIYEEDTKDAKVFSPEAGLAAHLQDLVQTLNMVSEFAKKRTTRNPLKRIISQKSDIGKVQEYRERLRQALDVFGLQSDITIRETVTRMAERQETLIKELHERETRRKGEAQQSVAPANIPLPASPSLSLSSLPPSPSGHAFSNINATNGKFTSIAGNQTISTVTNNNNSTNSGNNQVITITDSNNNSSVRNIWAPASFDPSFFRDD